MRTLLFLLEEASAKYLLQGLLPRLLPRSVVTEFLVFEGKTDLENSIQTKIRGWQRANTRFVILRDQDSADCRIVKERLATRIPASHRELTVVRIACRELESWLLGDWQALAEEFAQPKLAGNQNKRPFKNPDTLKNPVLELRKFLPGYGKCDGARRLGTRLHPDRNASPSFRTFCAAVQKLASTDPE